MGMPTSDWADGHVERWRDHWLEIAFDDEVEAITVRIGRINQYLRRSKRAAAAEVELQDFEYDTLHLLMIREAPGSATPSQLADDLGVSRAGMAGRLAALERSGLITRNTDAEDRRRVQVTVTDEGLTRWRRAMAARGHAEDELLGALDPQERRELADLLRRLTLHIEAVGDLTAPPT